MFSSTGVVKLTDFALSRIAVIPHFQYTPEDPKERERSGREARRLWYRPPELLFRKKFYSFEVDMWSMGCLLAEMALAEALFNGESEIE
jgi:cyclin-dependent kinase